MLVSAALLGGLVQSMKAKLKKDEGWNVDEKRDWRSEMEK